MHQDGIGSAWFKWNNLGGSITTLRVENGPRSEELEGPRSDCSTTAVVGPRPSR